MTVHVLMPVFNRLAMTKRTLNYLRAQKTYDSLNLIVIDDGSSDGTAEFLNSQRDICVLRGDGSLWWGGAIEIGLQHVLKFGHKSDWVLFINNDTQFDFHFIQKLIDVACVHAPAAVGSVVREETSPNKLLSIGVIFDTWRLQVRDKLAVSRLGGVSSSLHSVDALSGRGTILSSCRF
jgi:N-acetylglucosaminyl-diphospho-decaprenol L-rhamnosyltransferase